MFAMDGVWLEDEWVEIATMARVNEMNDEENLWDLLVDATSSLRSDGVMTRPATMEEAVRGSNANEPLTIRPSFTVDAAQAAEMQYRRYDHMWSHQVNPGLHRIHNSADPRLGNTQNKAVDKSFWSLSQCEAIYAFMSWLSDFQDPITLGAGEDHETHRALLRKFFEANDVPISVRGGFTEYFVSPPTTLEELGITPKPKSETDFFTQEEDHSNGRELTREVTRRLTDMDMIAW